LGLEVSCSEEHRDFLPYRRLAFYSLFNEGKISLFDKLLALLYVFDDPFIYSLEDLFLFFSEKHHVEMTALHDILVAKGI